MHFFRRLLDFVTRPLRALLYFPARLFSAGQRLLNISLPARAAILVAVFLVILVVTAFVAFYCTEDRVAWNYWVNPIRVLVITVLVIIIPFVVYRVLKLWLEGEVSRYPDIDYAWKAGLAELESHGLDLSQIPVFLILGSSGEAEEKPLFAGSRMSFRLREVPQGPAALHWYAHPDGIYLVCSDVGCSSALAARARDAAAQEKAGPVPAPPQSPGGSIRGTIVAGDQADPGPSAPPSEPRGTAGGAALPAAAGAIRGTMVVGAGAEEDDSAPAAVKKPVTMSPEDRTEQERRLQYVCRLIRRARQPLCPINGLLSLLPVGLIQRPREAIEVQRCVQRDLASIRRVLMLRCPVTALVTGMEDEPGFRELVRRVGPERAAAQRFGKGFSVWNPPTPERLRALAAHACGAFEDWVYALFREKGSLSKPGNTKLYALLCKIRRNVQNRLANILAAGYGTGSGDDADAEPMLFSGCYFAAAGETEDRQAFVRGVLDKLPDEQEELDWTRAALEEDGKYQLWAQLGFALNALLVVSLAAMSIYRWFPFWK